MRRIGGALGWDAQNLTEELLHRLLVDGREETARLLLLMLLLFTDVEPQHQGLERSSFANKTGALSRVVLVDITRGGEEERGDIKVGDESTRCWGIPGCSPREQLVGMVATRARWRVDSKEGEGVVMSISRESESVIDGDSENSDSAELMVGRSKSRVGAGEMGSVIEELGSGLTEVEASEAGGVGNDGIEDVVDVPFSGGIRDVIPCAASALITASQPCSSVLIRSFSSAFSRSLAPSESVR